ncbi:MAG: hypothetical protein JNG84_08580 [Archangium sp.]|nr:hypothetical protein [Archangium sp.]
MAVSPLRAVLAAHLQSTINRMLARVGKRGVWAMVAVLSLIIVTTVIPGLLGVGLLGFLFGQGLNGGADAERNLAVLGLLVSGLTLVASAFGGLSGSTRQLPWESLQAFPVTARTLFTAELVAAATEVVSVVEWLALLSICIGAGVAAPAAAPLLAVLFVTGGLTLLSTQLLVGSLALRVSKQTRVAFVMLPLVAVSLTTLLPRVASRLAAQTVVGATHGVLALGAALPAGRLLTAAREVVAGAPWSVAAWAMVPSVLLCGALVMGAFYAVSREQPLSTLDGGGPPPKVWTFSAKHLGMARLQWAALASSIPGRFGLLMPLLTLVVIRGPFAELSGRGPWLVPAAYGYAALAGTNLLFNQFGLDRHGIKALLLLPIDEATMLRGKQWGFAAWHLLQTVMLTVLLVVTGHTDVLSILVGLCISACFFLTLSMVGQFASLWQPRALTKNGMRGSQPPLLVVLLTLVAIFGSGGVYYGLLWALGAYAPGWELPVFIGVALVLVAAAELVLRANAVFMRASRERLVESLGASG